MAYSQIARALHERAGLRTEVCAIVLRELVELLRQRIRAGERTRIPGLGDIRPTYRRPRRVVCNLPDARLRGRTFEVPMRITAFLEPSPAFLREERIPVPSSRLKEWAQEAKRTRREWMPDVVG